MVETGEEKLTRDVRRMAVNHLVFGSKEPEALKRILRDVLTEFTIIELEAGQGKTVTVKWLYEPRNRRL